MTVAMLMTRVSFVNSVNNNDASRLMESVAAISDRWNNRHSCVGSSLWFSELQWIGVLAMLARVQATSESTIVGNDSLIQSLLQRSNNKVMD